MTDPSNQREFTRVPVHIWGTFRDGKREIVTTEITSLSLRGCYAPTFDGLPAGEVHYLTLFTEDEAQAIRFTVKACIVRSDEDGMGIEFTAMPLESYHHLRTMVLLNSSDPGKVEQEFRDHIGLKRAS